MMRAYRGRATSIILLLGLSWATLGAAYGRPAPRREEAGRPVLRVVYFIPSDREPEPDRVARLDRVVNEVSRFYAGGMKQNGYGPITFEPERGDDGRLRLREVRGKEPMHAYGRNDADKVRREVKAALATDGLDIDHETVLIFEVLLEWQGDRAIEVGPYVGGGDAHSGTAWVFDDAKLDADLLDSKEPGGYYAGPCSLGQFNTHYIGGVTHELGHALGLPHERERQDDRSARGLSLMGAGNHAYGQERRNEGPGAFLTPSSALPLSVHPLFTGRATPAVPVTCQVAELKAFSEKGSLILTGRLEGGPKVIGLVAQNDPLAIPGDYDALGTISTVDGDGQFRLVLEELKPGSYELRLSAYGESGDRTSYAYSYRVDDNRRADVRPFTEGRRLHEALAAFRVRDKSRFASIIEQLKHQPESDATLLRKVEHLRRLLSPQPLTAPADVPETVSTIAVTDLKMEASVGWGAPLRNQVQTEGAASPLIEVGGTFFESGLYAHAPSRYALSLRGKWATFHGAFGLQDGHEGSVVFVIKGDGKELYRSGPIRDHEAHEATVQVKGIDLLELLVEDARDGNTNDWGVWLAPQLRR